jgi:hypothetical protein
MIKLTASEINYFKMFGFLKIKNVFSRFELSMLKSNFDTAYEKYFNQSISRIILNSVVKGRTYMVPSFADNDNKILELFSDRGFFDVATSLLGPNVQYWGSDGSLFSYNSLWHRDTATLGRRCKINIYLNSGSENSGAFRVIPGSHHLGDEYTNMLGAACAWPSAANKGGLNEKGYLPNTKSPSHSIWKRLILDRDCPDIPHHIVDFKQGDALIFDDRTLHCVYAPFLPKPRRLITMLFTEMANTDRRHVSSDINFSADAINNEVSALKQMECNQYSVNAYPENLINFMKGRDMSNMVSMLKDYKPTVDKVYDGVHKTQHDELKNFLTRNYR